MHNPENPEDPTSEAAASLAASPALAVIDALSGARSLGLPDALGSRGSVWHRPPERRKAPGEKVSRSDVKKRNKRKAARAARKKGR